MFKDYHKYLSTTLKVYLFVLIVIFIMKIVGVDYFGLDVSNTFILNLNSFLKSYRLDYAYQTICLFFNFHLIKCITLNKYKIDFETFLIPTINLIIIYILYRCNRYDLYQILNISLLLAYFLIKKVKIKKILGVFILNIFCQFISSIIRNYNTHNYNILLNSIMNIDYYIMLLIWYHIEKQGGVELCQMVCQEVGSYLQKKLNLKILLKRLQENYLNFKKQNKETKLTIIIYFILSLIWNLFTIFIVLLIATLNHTFIECIFILTSFWLSKRVFGKAFHLSSMLHCFIVSNLTYYFLNRITTPLGISILVPIMLGVGLSYVTSKLVKKTYKPLYRGMPEDLFEEIILKVVDKDSIKYKICYESYILNKSDLSISFKYNYSLDNINKIKTRINNKIKKLN